MPAVVRPGADAGVAATGAGAEAPARPAGGVLVAAEARRTSSAAAADAVTGESVAAAPPAAGECTSGSRGCDSDPDRCLAMPPASDEPIAWSDCHP